ncbi:hypothetical protein BDN72DRAFT_879896 [Pluteus cervinus]|uniref:Uncharacterized protein n=1 Tax=Pluteus cervinus TaxID=181527 RepID=A0ACD3AMY8_9AGAR|nr:hypothetical protein BDN72DRAFT_879896 [Pluteus cervinus]
MTSIAEPTYFWFKPLSNTVHRKYTVVVRVGLRPSSTMMVTSSSPQLLDIPMELVLKILPDTPTDLLTLASTCRFFNLLIMPQFLRLPDSGHVDVVDLSFDGDTLTVRVSHTGYPRLITHRFLADRNQLGTMNSFAFLSLNFGIKSVGKLICRFTSSLITHSTSPISQIIQAFIHQYERFTAFIRRLQKISHIALHFDLRNLFADRIPERLVQSWTASLDALLVAGMEKQSELHVYGGKFPTTVFENSLKRGWVSQITSLFMPPTTNPKIRDLHKLGRRPILPFLD